MRTRIRRLCEEAMPTVLDRVDTIHQEVEQLDGVDTLPAASVAARRLYVLSDGEAKADDRCPEQLHLVCKGRDPNRVDCLWGSGAQHLEVTHQILANLAHLLVEGIEHLSDLVCGICRLGAHARSIPDPDATRP